MDKKITAVLIVVILLVAGVSAAFLLMNDDDETSEVVHEGRLLVYGNANNDDYLDDKDVKFIEKIIKVNSDDDASNDIIWQKTNPFADVDNNGTVNSTDVELAKKLADRNVTSMKYMDATGKVEDVKYPVNYVMGTGTYVLDGLVYLGATEKVVGIHGSKSWPNSDTWKDLKDKPKISTGAGMADFELISNLEHKDALVCTSSLVKDAEDLELAGVDVLSLHFGDSDEISGFLMLGLFLQLEERSHKLAEFYDKIYDLRDQGIEKYKSEKTQTVMLTYMDKWVYSDAGKHGTLSESLGIDNIWHYNSSTDASNYVKILGGEEWLSNPEWQADWIIGQEKWLYNDDGNPVEKWKIHDGYYSSLKCFPEKCILINDSMAEPLKIAYLLEYIFPGIVEKGFGDKVHQEFIDSFVDALSGNYDITEHGTFLVTYDDVKDKL